MRIRFYGPISRVTGSCYHLIDDSRGEEYLVDCGLVQNEGAQLLDAAGEFPFDVSRITHVFLTHAHLDHCGLIPYLYRLGYSGQVWCTHETAEIATINLMDSARLGGVPYDASDVEGIRWWEPQITPLFNRLTPFGHDRFLCFYRTAHVLGAVSIGITWGPRDKGQRTIVFSGDLGVNADGEETQALLRYRMDVRNMDYIVCESTYGDQARPPVPWEQRLNALSAALESPLAACGVAIIPVFSIGRYQDLLFDLMVLRARYPTRFADVDIVVDSPMGERVTQVYADAIRRTDIIRDREPKPAWLNSRLVEWLGMEPSPEGDELMRDLVASVLEGKEPPVRIAEKYPDSTASRMDGRSVRRGVGRWGVSDSVTTIVICSGGMCEGGPIVSYLQDHITRKTTTVIFPGYVATGTLGNQLLRLKDVPLSERSRLGGTIKLSNGNGPLTMAESSVQAEIVKIDGYSGHADQAGLADWLISPESGEPAASTVFLTHGTDQARHALRDCVLGRNDEMCVEVPETSHGYYDLDLGRWCDTDVEETEFHRLKRRTEMLEAELALAKGQRAG
jgi:metallo-beta-lactamase family protein